MRVLIVVFATAATVVACTAADIDGTPLGGKGPSTGTVGKRAGELECTGASTLAPEDPNKLPKCACAKGGAARCVPKDKIPGSLASQLDQCEGGSCVPDDLVKSGGAAPPTCQSNFGEGRCMNMCVPEVATPDPSAGPSERSASTMKLAGMATFWVTPEPPTMVDPTPAPSTTIHAPALPDRPMVKGW